MNAKPEFCPECGEKFEYGDGYLCGSYHTADGGFVQAPHCQLRCALATIDELESRLAESERLRKVAEELLQELVVNPPVEKEETQYSKCAVCGRGIWEHAENCWVVRATNSLKHGPSTLTFADVAESEVDDEAR